MHRLEDDARNVDRDRMRWMFHDQFDAHLTHDVDQKAVVEIDPDDSHAECPAKTCSQQSSAFVLRSLHLERKRKQRISSKKRSEGVCILTIKIAQCGMVIDCELSSCVCFVEIMKKHIHRWEIEESMVEVEDDGVVVAE